MSEQADAAHRLLADLSEASALQATAAGWQLGRAGAVCASANPFVALGVAAGRTSSDDVLAVLDRHRGAAGLPFVASMLCSAWMGPELLEFVARRGARFSAGRMVGHTDTARLVAIATELGPFSNVVDVAAELHLRSAATDATWATVTQRGTWTDPNFANQWLRVEARRDLSAARDRLRRLELDFGRGHLTFGADAVLGRLTEEEAVAWVSREGPWECADWLHALVLQGRLDADGGALVRRILAERLPDRDGLVVRALAAIPYSTLATEALTSQAERAPEAVASDLAAGLQRVYRHQPDDAEAWTYALLAALPGEEAWRRRVRDLVVVGCGPEDLFGAPWDRGRVP